MAREKKPVHRVQMTEGKRNIIRQLLEEYGYSISRRYSRRSKRSSRWNDQRDDGSRDG